LEVRTSPFSSNSVAEPWTTLLPQSSDLLIRVADGHRGGALVEHDGAAGHRRDHAPGDVRGESAAGELVGVAHRPGAAGEGEVGAEREDVGGAEARHEDLATRAGAVAGEDDVTQVGLELDTGQLGAVGSGLELDELARGAGHEQGVVGRVVDGAEAREAARRVAHAAAREELASRHVHGDDVVRVAQRHVGPPGAVHDHPARLVPGLQGELVRGEVALEVDEEDAVPVGVGDDRDPEIMGDGQGAAGDGGGPDLRGMDRLGARSVYDDVVFGRRGRRIVALAAGRQGEERGDGE
jgi:hypothetical protein